MYLSNVKNIENLSKGIYFVKLFNTENELKTIKLIKE
jgi:hypothetical protein